MYKTFSAIMCKYIGDTFIVNCRYLFYSDMGKPQRIERSSLIGKDRKSIVTSGVDRVYDITVDHKEQTLYWVDAGRHTLESSDFDGRNRRLLTRMNSVKFTSVVVFGVRIKHIMMFMLYMHSFKHFFKIWVKMKNN